MKQNEWNSFDHPLIFSYAKKGCNEQSGYEIPLFHLYSKHLRMAEVSQNLKENDHAYVI